jgi:hypothetical protein
MGNREKALEIDRIGGAHDLPTLIDPLITRAVRIDFYAETIGVNQIDCLAIKVIARSEMDSLIDKVRDEAAE